MVLGAGATRRIYDKGSLKSYLGLPFNGLKVSRRALNASYYIGRIWNGTAKRSSVV